MDGPIRTKGARSALWVAALCGSCAGPISVGELNLRATQADVRKDERIEVSGAVREVVQLQRPTVRAQLDAEAGVPSYSLRSGRPSVVLEDAAGRAELWFDPKDNAWVGGLRPGQALTVSCRFERFDMARGLAVLDGCLSD